MATSVTGYIYDGWNLIAEYNLLSPPGIVLRRHTWCLDLSGTLQGAGGVGGLVMTESFDPANLGTWFPLYDGNGNLTDLLAPDTTLVAHYEYGPFGEIISSTGPAANSIPFRFSTKYEDAETGLLYYGYRYYDSSAGRWLNRDPIQENGGINMYAFVYNTTLTYIDTFGNEPLEITRLPAGGTWDGAPGNSNWSGPKNSNPIPFFNGTPDFKATAKYNVKIPLSSGDRYADMKEAIRELQETQNRAFERSPGYVWHHHFSPDGSVNMQYVASKDHAPIAHAGPVCAAGRSWSVNQRMSFRAAQRGDRAAAIAAAPAVALAWIEMFAAVRDGETVASGMGAAFAQCRQQREQVIAKQGEGCCGCCIISITRSWSQTSYTTGGWFGSSVQWHPPGGFVLKSSVNGTYVERDCSEQSKIPPLRGGGPDNTTVDETFSNNF